MDFPEPELETRVRVFPDYADSVIWFCIGPMPYDEARISPGLQAAMEAWEQTYYDGIDNQHYEWKSRAEHQRFNAEGLRLGAILADELGEQFEVEVDAEVGSSESKTIFRSPGKPTNREAAIAFQTRAQELLEFERYVKRVRDAGGSFGFSFD
jgi:hypothetical protein